MPDTQSTAPQENTEPAGNIVVYTSRAEALFKPVVAAFNEEYPNVAVTLLTGRAGIAGAHAAARARRAGHGRFAGCQTR